MKLDEGCYLWWIIVWLFGSYVLTDILGERENEKTEMIIKFISRSCFFFLAQKRIKLLELKGSRDFTQPKNNQNVCLMLQVS